MSTSQIFPSFPQEREGFSNYWALFSAPTWRFKSYVPLKVGTTSTFKERGNGSATALTEAGIVLQFSIFYNSVVQGCPYPSLLIQNINYEASSSLTGHRRIVLMYGACRIWISRLRSDGVGGCSCVRGTFHPPNAFVIYPHMSKMQLWEIPPRPKISCYMVMLSDNCVSILLIGFASRCIVMNLIFGTYSFHSRMCAF